MDGVAGASADQRKPTYAERWELLRDVMTRLYMDEKKTVKEIVEIMKADYQFWATENQYKGQFGRWKMKRALSKEKKIKIGKALDTRAQQGKSSVVLHHGKMEVRKIRRHLKEQGRRDISIWTRMSNGAVAIENLSGHALQCGNRVFMNWSIPGTILRFLKTKPVDHISPKSLVGTPMSGIVVATPPSAAGPSPLSHASPVNALSPNNERAIMSVAVQENLQINRAHLFVQKHHKDLLQGMNLQEQYITTNWLHQFWQYSFTTARTWGRGPQSWNSTSLRFNQLPEEMIESLPGTPATNLKLPEQHSHHQSPQAKVHIISNNQKPSVLCRLSIHVREQKYDRVPSPPPAADLVDPDIESSWRPWTTPRTIHDFANSLQENLESNDFSNIELKDLPISSGQIARAAKRSPDQLLEEAFGFSIMARNRELVHNMLKYINKNPKFSLNELFPLHLAASYLDGSKTCCSLFDDIVMGMPTGEASVRKLYINHLNHTVLDNLMIAILKAHTSCTPIMVDETFKKEYRFAGEEVDICGRWDADSDCIRHLQANGSPIIPHGWKHMFCHTSAQAISHCIGTLFLSYWRPDINTPSGLFIKRCLNEGCGVKLQLKPLHTLVITAFYLAQLGCDGENLFGIIACLFSLLGKGADPLLSADISLMALLSGEDNQECNHSELDPWELAQKVPYDLISKWSQERITGWKILCAVLRLSQLARTRDTFRRIYGAFVEDIDKDIIGIELLAMDVDKRNNVARDVNVDEDEYDDDECFSPFCYEHGKYCDRQNFFGWQNFFGRQNAFGRQNFFGKNKSLATLWAAVQIEMLTYRRIAEGDPWISANFDMRSVANSLENGDKIAIDLVSKKMIKQFCGCGIFSDSDDSACLRVEEASTHYFSNLEDWTRSTFLPCPEERMLIW